MASAQECGDRVEEAHAHRELARLAQAGVNRLRARLLLHKALAPYHRVDDRAGTVAALEDVAGLVAGDGRLTEAAELLGSAHAARDALRLHRPVRDQAGYEGNLGVVRRGLGARELHDE